MDGYIAMDTDLLAPRKAAVAFWKLSILASDSRMNLS